MKFLGGVVNEGPSLYHIPVEIKESVECLITSIGGKHDLEVLLALVGDCPDNHEDVSIVRAEVRGELHVERKGRVVDGRLREEREAVVWVWEVDHPGGGRGEGDVLTGAGHAGVEGVRDPGLVPPTDRGLLIVVDPVLGPEVPVQPAGVAGLRAVLSVAVPLPGACSQMMTNL